MAVERVHPAQTSTDAKALSAMANPVRSRMLDALAVDGPSTASALASRIGQAVGSASHHLKVLAEAGLVAEAPELAKDRRERWWRLVAPSTRWSRSELDDAGAITAALAAESLALHRQFERSQEYLAASTDDPESFGFAAQSWLNVSPAELREVSEELVALIQKWSRRTIADDGVERDSCFVFVRGFPAQP